MKKLHIKYHTRSVKIPFFFFLKWHIGKIQQYEKEDIIRKKLEEKDSLILVITLTPK